MPKPDLFISDPFDTKALAMGVLGLAWSETALKTVAERVGAEHEDPSTLHHAGADARHTARVFSALMNQRTEEIQPTISSSKSPR